MTRILDNSGLKSSYLSNSMDNIDDNTKYNIVYEMTIHDNTSTELLLCMIQYKAILYNTFEYWRKILYIIVQYWQYKTIYNNT